MLRSQSRPTFLRAEPILFLSVFIFAVILGYSFARSLLPPHSHTYFPLITPSGFSIGTILKMKVSRRASASLLSPMRCSIEPFITQLALDSPGCTRAERNMYGRFSIEGDTRIVKTQTASWQTLCEENDSLNCSRLSASSDLG